MKRVIALTALIFMTIISLTACASKSPEEQVAQTCLSNLRDEIEQNVPGTSEEWLAYEMSTEIELVKTETYDGGGAYTFEGTATLTADDLLTKTVEFTCFGNKRDDKGDAGGSIQTINGECTIARETRGHC